MGDSMKAAVADGTCAQAGRGNQGDQAGSRILSVAAAVPSTLWKPAEAGQDWLWSPAAPGSAETLGAATGGEEGDGRGQNVP